MTVDVKAAADALGDVSKGVTALWDIAKVFGRAYKAATKRIRPDYEACAADFRLICTDLHEYTGRFIEFLERHRGFSFDEPDQAKRYRDLYTELHSGDLAALASQLKFRCGEIDTYYNQRCETWVRKKYADLTSAKKKEAALQAFKKLTAMDATLIETVTTRVLTPLRAESGRIHDALQKGDLELARQLHRRFRIETRDTVNILTHDRMKLDEARDAFDAVANPPRTA